ncbi:hypothetical protein Bca52824_000305 [Brassica carinata]|uniref:Uncharacterized protein n=1 Tax=Brassica carinata TaxID=52824 RepID=A0A8X8BBJ6_BRACI|nr:hypothetical protein Bca52824_000305 [Brassica carinata]
MALIQQPVQATSSSYGNETIQTTHCFSRSTFQLHTSSSPVRTLHITSVSLTLTTCSTKSPKERTDKKSSGLISTRHQVDPKRELSRILRTDAAVKSIERKANSEKYNTLWPKLFSKH